MSLNCDVSKLAIGNQSLVNNNVNRSSRSSWLKDSFLIKIIELLLTIASLGTFCRVRNYYSNQLIFVKISKTSTLSCRIFHPFFLLKSFIKTCHKHDVIYGHRLHLGLFTKDVMWFLGFWLPPPPFSASEESYHNNKGRPDPHPLPT